MFGNLLERFGLGRREPLGRMLVRAQVISEDQLRKALDIQRSTKKQLGQIIVEQKFASEYNVLQAIAKYYRVSATALSDDFAALLEPRTTTWRDKLAHLRIPIGIKLSIAITFMIWLTILTLSVVMLARQRDRLYAQTMRTGTVSLNYFANNAALPLLEDDTLRLNSLIKDSASVEGLVYASIVDRAGVIKAHTDTSLIGSPAPARPAAESSRTEGSTTSVTYRGPDGAHLMNIARPVTYSGTTLGRGQRRDLARLHRQPDPPREPDDHRPLALHRAARDLDRDHDRRRLRAPDLAARPRHPGDRQGQLPVPRRARARRRVRRPGLGLQLHVPRAVEEARHDQVLRQLRQPGDPRDGHGAPRRRPARRQAHGGHRGLHRHPRLHGLRRGQRRRSASSRRSTSTSRSRRGTSSCRAATSTSSSATPCSASSASPLAQPDHALRALRASVAMQRELLAQDAAAQPAAREGRHRDQLRAWRSPATSARRSSASTA